MAQRKYKYETYNYKSFMINEQLKYFYEKLIEATKIPREFLIVDYYEKI